VGTAISTALSKALFDDPLMAWAIPDEDGDSG
jgi:hypothetical protein